MKLYTSFDYLCNEPFFVPEIGTIRSPTLRDIRKITHNVFNIYVNICMTKTDDFLKLSNLHDKYNTLFCHGQGVPLFSILLYEMPQILVGLLNFFLSEEIRFSEDAETFLVFGEDKAKEPVGKINSENFDKLRGEALRILGMTQVDPREENYKNDMARALVEKIKKDKERFLKNKGQDEKQDDTMDLDNMVKKYCTHNKVGINILNVWDMTYYQFAAMFQEYSLGRQADISDAIAANTFSYENSEAYKPYQWMDILSKQ